MILSNRSRTPDGRSRHANRSARRRRPLRCEGLEGRTLLSVSPQLLKDLNLDTVSSSPSEITDVNGIAFFTADDGVHGAELWRTDGTASGTSLVADINPGGDSSSPTELTAVGGTLFFRADDGRTAASCGPTVPGPK